MLPTPELLDLKETFLVQEDLYNIAELRSGIISEKFV